MSFVIRPLLVALAITLIATPAQAAKLNYKAGSKVSFHITRVKASADASKFKPTPVFGTSLVDDVVLQPVAPDVARSRALEDLTPLWRVELGKFKTQAKLSEVRRRHLSTIAFAQRSMSRAIERVPATRPKSRETLLQNANWCRAAWLAYGWTDTNRDDPSTAEHMASLQASASICYENAAGMTVIAAMLAYAGKQDEKKPN